MNLSDVKNLKLKIRPEEQHQFNSPWNVAADYDLDMTFNPQEISTMLSDYENDYHFGFNIKEISEEIYKYTSGYPVLVSRVCKEIDENLGKTWTKDGVLKAVKNIVNDDKFVLLDDISKNLQRDFLFKKDDVKNIDIINIYKSKDPEYPRFSLLNVKFNEGFSQCSEMRVFIDRKNMNLSYCSLF